MEPTGTLSGVPRRRWQFPLLALGLIALFLILRRAIGIELHPDSMREAVQGLGFWGPLVFVGIVIFRIPLMVPSAIVLIAGGLLFGTALGTLYGTLGLSVSAIVVFTTARWTGRSAIEARMPPRLRYLLDVAGSRAGAIFIAVGSAYPMSPITSYHLIAGVTGMSVAMFFAAAAVGCGARAALYTYFGSSLIEADPLQMVIAGGLLLASLLAPLAFSAPRAWLLDSLAGREPIEPA
jgi:uncharacterized membrane protein YdjX (TVP38/TMEM64 family)